jgi:hypothetical protein
MVKLFRLTLEKPDIRVYVPFKIYLHSISQDAVPSKSRLQWPVIMRTFRPSGVYLLTGIGVYNSSHVSCWVAYVGPHSASLVAQMKAYPLGPGSIYWKSQYVFRICWLGRGWLPQMSIKHVTDTLFILSLVKCVSVWNAFAISTRQGEKRRKNVYSETCIKGNLSLLTGMQGYKNP